MSETPFLTSEIMRISNWRDLSDDVIIAHFREANPYLITSTIERVIQQARKLKVHP